MHDPFQSLQRAMEQLRSLEGMFAGGQVPSPMSRFFDPEVWRDLEQAAANWGGRPLQPMGGAQPTEGAEAQSKGPATATRMGPMMPGPAAGEPRLDIFVTESEVLISAAVPGIERPQDLSVSVLGETRLRLSGQIPPHPLSSQTRAIAAERHHGPFSRTIVLPVPVRAESARSTYRSGLLEIRLERCRDHEQPITVTF